MRASVWNWTSASRCFSIGMDLLIVSSLAARSPLPRKRSLTLYTRPMPPFPRRPRISYRFLRRRDITFFTTEFTENFSFVTLCSLRSLWLNSSVVFRPALRAELRIRPQRTAAARTRTAALPAKHDPGPADRDDVAVGAPLGPRDPLVVHEGPRRRALVLDDVAVAVTPHLGMPLLHGAVFEQAERVSFVPVPRTRLRWPLSWRRPMLLCDLAPSPATHRRGMARAPPGTPPPAPKREDLGWKYARSAVGPDRSASDTFRRYSARFSVVNVTTYSLWILLLIVS